MKTLNSLLRFSLALAAVTALTTASTAQAQVDLTRMAWVGDSEGAGYSAGCLTKRVQVDSPGAVIARTNGVDYQQPIINDPGIGKCMILTSLAPSFGAEAGTGTPANLALPRPYNNLSVGGCAIHDMLTATTGAQTVGPGTCRNTIDLVLRNSALHLGSMVDQAIALNPTFVFLENVGNDYLGAVLSGTFIDGVTITPVASFAADTSAAVSKLAARQPKGIVFGVADVTSIPFTTTLPPFLTSGGKLVLNPQTGAPIPLLGPKNCGAAPACPIPATTLVTLNAAAYLPSGFGIPCAVAPSLPNCNKPLPAAGDPATGNPGALIYAADVALLKQRFADYNAAVKAAAAASGYKFYDTNDFLLRLKAGFDIGGITINASFLTGGAFSYDGFHLTPIGYALLADDLTAFINANFNADLPRVNLTTYLFNGGTNGGLAGSFSYAPLNGQDYERAVQGIFTPEFARELASMFSQFNPPLIQGDSGPVQRLERHSRQPERP